MFWVSRLGEEEKKNEIVEALLFDYLTFLVFILVLALCIIVFVKSATAMLVRMGVIKWHSVKLAVLML